MDKYDPLIIPTIVFDLDFVSVNVKPVAKTAAEFVLETLPKRQINLTGDCGETSPATKSEDRKSGTSLLRLQL